VYTISREYSTDLLLCFPRIGSGKQVTSVIVDNGKDDDDDETFVVEDNHPMTNDIDAVSRHFIAGLYETS